MVHELELWRRMTADDTASLRVAAAQADPGDVSAVTALRREWPAELVRVALELAGARRRLLRKWPQRAEQMLSDRAGAEMASSERAARHKASRFASAAEATRRIVDLCSGIGADTVALSEAANGDELDLTALDLDPARALMTEHNAGVTCAVQDAEALDPTDALIHLDPQRRTGAGTRSRWSFDQHQPGPAAITQLATRARGAAIKLGPGLDTGTDAAHPLLANAEIEIISEQGSLTQAVVWTGALRSASDRRATLLDGDHSHTVHGPAESWHAVPLTPNDTSSGGSLYEPDPALERAGLLAMMARCHHLGALHPFVGVLAGAPGIASPWLTEFELLERLPWKPKRVRAALAALGAGIVEVKTMGRAVDPDRVQGQLRGSGDQHLTVFVLRFGGPIEAFITRRKERIA